MTLRAWQFSDIYTIAQMEKDLFTNEAWSYQTLVTAFQTGGFYGLVAVEGDEIIGYGSINLAVDDADVQNIAVAESYRRQGIGQSILFALEQEVIARGAKKIFLEVRISNAPAMLMYLKNGYVGSYARLRYYSGEDCVVMVKNL